MQGKIDAGIDDSNALLLMRMLPSRYLFAHHFWTWIWILSIFGAIFAAIFYKLALGILVFVFGVIVYKATKKSASKFVLEHALLNEEFFGYLVERDLLVFRHKGD